MGNWHISIQGVGVHNNSQSDTPEDADRMARRFVRELKKAGHQIAKATFTQGGAESLNEGHDVTSLISEPPSPRVDRELQPPTGVQGGVNAAPKTDDDK